MIQYPCNVIYINETDSFLKKHITEDRNLADRNKQPVMLPGISVKTSHFILFYYRQRCLNLTTDGLMPVVSGKGRIVAFIV